ncbi:protein HAIKU1-like [Andrographis paniculata]|uniref:protein HAIKU1-like n=1 Tax=Andrographis paniculata TaxID=175694 RepID=UPI0021E885F7|nr:protein HAIKU1-like [Andrographis paniculata]
MDSSNQQSMNRQQMDHLGVNKMGKNIKKSPIHQPNFGNSGNKQPQQPQPQVYNINKNDFRNIVQQLTGSPAREPPPRPPQNNRKPPNNRLMRVRPPPLAPSRPQVPPVRPQPPNAMAPQVPAPYPNTFMRPPPPSQYDQLSPALMLPPTPPDVWTNTTESPISAYMRYLQTSILDSAPQQNSSQPQVPGQSLPHPQYHPNPVMAQAASQRGMGPLPSPRMNGPPPLLASPNVKGPPPGLPSPRMTGPPPLLPSPTSQFLLPSPSGFFNMLSPRSPHPFMSPGAYQHLPPPISPGFSFSPIGQSGILGPGPPPPPSPGYGFPLSPGIFPISSPRWRDH